MHKGLFSGRMFDAYGPHALLIPGSVIFIVSLMLISRKWHNCSGKLTPVCKEYYQFMLAQGVLFGLGSALIFQPTISTPSQWFAKKRAMATAIVVCGSGIGGTLWPIALQRMFNQIGEWVGGLLWQWKVPHSRRRHPYRNEGLTDTDTQASDGRFALRGSLPWEPWDWETRSSVGVFRAANPLLSGALSSRSRRCLIPSSVPEQLSLSGGKIKI